MKNLKYIFFVAVVLLAQSCDNWLDVRPEDTVGEDELFQSKEGVEKIRNGLFLKLASPSLYSMNLGGGVLDVMGQLYNISEKVGSDELSIYIPYINYNYLDANVKYTMDDIWVGTYEVIGNINNVLEKSTLYKEHYTAEEYNTIRGELIGLRAFLHFDMLRLFGPMPNGTNGSLTSIPYYRERTVSAAPLSTFDEIIAMVNEDLALAEKLLMDDPVFSSETKRRFRFNYVAVKATQARVALYVGNKKMAAELARQIVGGAGIISNLVKNVMPWVAFDDAKSTSNPDRYFTKEIIFGVENSRRQNVYLDNYEYNVTNDYYLAPNMEFYSMLYSDPIMDFRSNAWRTNPGNGRLLEFAKYQVMGSFNAERKYIQPLIRKSEMSLILAEATSDATEAYNILNELYINRGYQSGAVRSLIDAVGLEQFILDEYMRECYGEGQYFYHLKRRAVSTVRKQAAGETVNMSSSQYVVPLPDSEIKFRD
ncbi:MAG: RagB/SusD family nutrient uptake outer membrane protein [Marinifilaceae bacterium]